MLKINRLNAVFLFQGEEDDNEESQTKGKDLVWKGKGEYNESRRQTCNELQRYNFFKITER